MGGCRCTFRNCTVGTSQYPGMHFFRFPINDRERYLRWLSLANVIHFLEMPKVFQKNRVICARHFRPECFKNYKRDGILPKNVEPTLMPLNEDVALDYANEEENGGPELIKMPTATMKHLIPPPGYIFPFSLHDNLNPSEYIKQNNIVLANPATQSKKIKRNREAQMDIEDSSSFKKIKVLNSDNISICSKFSETIPSETIVKLNFNENGYLLDNSDEISFHEESGALIDYANENQSSSPQLDDHEFMNESSIDLPNSNIVLNQEWEIVAHELQKKDTRSETSSQEETYCINSVEEQLESSDEETESKTNTLHKTEDDLSKENLKLKTNLEKYNKLLERFKQLEKQHEATKEQLNSKTITLNRITEDLKTANFKLKNAQQEYKELNVNYKQLLKREQCISEEILRLKEENSQLHEKCKIYEKEKKQKQIVEVSTSQAGLLAATESSNVNCRQTAAACSMQNSLTKAQLFNGVKKYISSSMVALLRMEMFGSSDREWKPDEKRVAIDLLQLGDQVYGYISDEWRFRLPALGEVRNWLSDTTNSIDDEEDLY